MTVEKKGLSMSLDELFRATEPATAIRGVHLDLKGTPPTSERLVELLRLFAAARYNAVLVEWEDTFPWTVDERFRCESAYTPAQVEQFCQAAGQLGLEVIPLVQCLGHMETPLSVGRYEHLREEPHCSCALNPLARGARELIERMVQDVLSLLPKPRWFHLGGDEAWSFGTHPETRAYVQRHGKGALYLHHVEPILDLLARAGIRPILWHDMMRQWDSQALRRLAEKADLCVWGYRGHPDTTTGHYNTEVIRRFADHGMTMWAATAYKGASGQDADLTDQALHRENALAWVEVAGRFDFRGVFATAWSRYSTHNVHCETIEATLDSMLEVGCILHDGRPPAGGIEACRAALAELPEAERFPACRAAMERLSSARRAGWDAVKLLRQVVVMATLDARRRSGGVLAANLGRLRRAVVEAEAAARDAR
ncbi:MAG: hypothetical protein B1H04_02070, partial [Planctomycetales bacterium 4484_123]